MSQYIQKIRNYPHFWPLVFFGAALLLRFVYFWQIKSDPIFHLPILDAAYYDRWAKDIVAGREFTSTAFFVEPGYAYFLALIYKIFSVGRVFPVIFQFLLSSATAALVYLIGTKMFSRFVGIAAGLFMLTLRPWLFYDALLLKTSVEIFLLTLVLYLASVAFEKQNTRQFLVLGLAVGTAAIFKANIFYSVPFLVLAMFFTVRKTGGDRQTGKKSFLNFLLEKTKGQWKNILLLLIGVIIPIFPVTIYNWQASRSFVPINYSGGPNIYIGNWYGSDGSLKPPEFISMSPGSEETSWIKMTEAYLGEKVTPAQISSYWTGRAIQEAWSDKKFFLMNTGKKVLLLFHSLPLDDNYSIEYGLERLPVLRYTLPFWILAVTGLAGLVASLIGKKRRELLWFYAILAGYSLTLVAAHVAERYRIALAPMLALLAGYFVHWLWQKMKEENIPSIGIALVILASLLWLPFVSLGQISRTLPADTWNNLGSEALDQGKRQEAAEYFQKSLEAEPRLPYPYANLGKIELEDGKIEEALEKLRKALRLQPDGQTAILKIALEAQKNQTPADEINIQIEELKSKNSDELFDPDYIEGVKLLREQKYQEALERLEKAKEKHPNNGQILSNVGMAYKNLDDLNKAKENLALAILQDGYNLPARYNMGNLLRKKKESDLALTQFSIINSLVPGYMLTQMQLAELQLGKNNAAAAVTLYRQFLENKDSLSLYPEQKTKAEEMLQKISSQPGAPEFQPQSGN